MRILHALVLSACLTGVAAAGVPEWEAAIAALSPGYVATGIAAPTQADIGAYDIATGGGITYEVIYNADVGGASSAFLGSLGAPEGDSAGLKLDQWPNSGTYGVTLFGVADITGATPHILNTPTHVALVADGTDGILYVNGVEVETMPGASFALSGLTGIGHAYNHGSDGSVDPLNGEILGIAVYDSALSGDAIAANFAAFVPEPTSAALVALGLLAGVSKRVRS